MSLAWCLLIQTGGKAVVPSVVEPEDVSQSCWGAFPEECGGDLSDGRELARSDDQCRGFRVQLLPTPSCTPLPRFLEFPSVRQ